MLRYTVVQCNEEIYIPDNPEVEQLTGLLRSYPEDVVKSGNCEMTILNLEKRHLTIKFETLYKFFDNSLNKWIFNNKEFSFLPSEVFVQTESGKVRMQYQYNADPTHGNIAATVFYIKFTGKVQSVFVYYTGICV